MKQVKFLLVVLMALVMTMSVSSCMKGDDNSIIERREFVRVDKYDIPVSFKNMAGEKLTPTQPIMTADEDLALIYYQYDRTTIAANSTSVTITLLADPSYINETYVVTSPVTANAPLITLEPATPYGAVTGGFFDKNTLLLPIAYKYKKYDKTEDAIAEQKKHSFALVYDAEKDFTNGVLTLHLRHNAEAITDGDEKVERKDNVYEYRAFNLSNVLLKFSSKPTSIKVVIEQKDDDKLEGAKDASFTFDYLFKE